MISTYPARFNPSSNPCESPLAPRPCLLGSPSSSLHPLQSAGSSINPLSPALPQKVSITSLESTLTRMPASVDSKGLRRILTSLESTLTKNLGGGGVMVNRQCGCPLYTAALRWSTIYRALLPAHSTLLAQPSSSSAPSICTAGCRRCVGMSVFRS